MKESLSDILRRCASFIEVDDTPTDEDIKKKRELKKSPGLESPAPSTAVVSDGKPAPTALPSVRRPRRLHEHQKKWNDESKKGLMKDYMQQYRAEGKDLETNSPKSKYVKKPKF